MQLTKSIHCLNAYNNSYLMIDNKILVIDAVDAHDSDSWLKQIDLLLSNRQPDYFIITHIYQTSAIISLCQKYPHMQLMTSLHILEALHLSHLSNPIHILRDNEMIHLGEYTILLRIINDMILIYNKENRVLFSSLLFSIENQRQPWNEEARYYYVNHIHHTPLLLDIIQSLDYAIICPFEGQVIDHDIKQYIRYYELWLQCIPEEDGVFILTDSHNPLIYNACLYLQKQLIQYGDTAFLYDISMGKTGFAYCQSLKYDRIIISTPMINVESFIYALKNRVICGIYDDIEPLNELKRSVSCLDNILYVDTCIINADNYQLLMNSLVHTIMEVGCSDGVCI